MYFSIQTLKTEELSLKFQELLLYLLYELRNERTASAPYHLLKGKKSGQTIQDVGLFSLYPYFALLPKLSRQTYDEALRQLVATEKIDLFDDGYYKVLQQPNTILPYFNGWYYRSNEHIFFARLALAVQTLSQQQAGDLHFVPLQKDMYVQQFIRDFLTWAQYTRSDLGSVLKQELFFICEQLTQQDAQLLVLRLTGASTSGYSWVQIAQFYDDSPLNIQLQFISVLHQSLQQIEKNPQLVLLNALAQQIKVDIVVTSSAAQTVRYYNEGYTMEQIASMRQLKLSTIEDHIVELAMHDENFQMISFVTQQEEQNVLALSQALQTKKLKRLKEALPQLSYFQLRLILARGGR